MMGSTTDTLRAGLIRIRRDGVRRKFLVLLTSLILLLALYPYVGPEDGGEIFFKVLTSIVLIAGVHAVGDSRRALVVAGLFASAALLSGWLYVVTGIPTLNTAENAISLVFYAYTTIIILSVVLRSRTITTDTIYGAVSVYLLIGLTFANGYTFIETVYPGSFYASTVHDPGGSLAFQDLLYYSFVTMTTLGYGDITPVTDQARSLAMLEAVSGVLYVAVLISRLIGSLGRSSEQDGDAEQKK